MVTAGSSRHPNLDKATQKPENRLKRDTPFVSNIRFRTSLPEVPCDPKMLVAVLQPDKLSQFNITTLEQDMRQDLILESGVGIPLSLLDTERYAVPDTIQQLAPEDAALVMGPTAEEGPGGLNRRERLRGDGTEVSWLMRTTYIANEMEEHRQQGSAETRRAADTEEEANDRETQILTIERSFEEARTPPLHSQDPSLTPVEIMPVLPDLDRWRDTYVRMAFDGEPTADYDRIANLPPEAVKQLAEHAIMKSFTLQGDQPKKEQKFVAYMLPLDAPTHPSNASSSSRGGDEVSVSYEWVREYNFRVHNAKDHRTFWFHFDNGHVTYTELNTKLSLFKRGKQATTQAFPRPSEVNLKRRRMTDIEDEAGRKKLRELTGDDEIHGEES